LSLDIALGGESKSLLTDECSDLEVNTKINIFRQYIPPIENARFK
jgi:hypothetical protein